MFNTKLSVLVGAFFYLITYLLHKLFIGIWSHRGDGRTQALQSIQSKTRCDSHLESWLKNQRNVFALCHYERALWNTSIKSPIVTVNVKLIGRTLWEELLSYVGPLIWRVTAGYSCVPAPVLRASLQPLILLCRKPHKQYGKGTVLKLVWTRWSCSFHAKCTYKKNSFKHVWRAKKQSWQTGGETLERSESSQHVKNVKLKVLIWTDREWRWRNFLRFKTMYILTLQTVKESTNCWLPGPHRKKLPPF